MKRGLFLLPLLLCLLVHWASLSAWFRADDFAWLAVGVGRDVVHALFAPFAQGTIRPLSERAFFMAGFGLFGLDAMPFRIVVFATQFANLALVAWIGARLTGLRAAGVCAAVFWVVNSALVEPLGWVCVYNQVLCGFFLLLAFYFLLRYVETGRARYNLGQWIAFLLGFGALEVNLVYPALAASYTFLCARKNFRRTLPLFLPSILYVVAHRALVPLPGTGDYALHFTGSMLRTLATYWTWSAGPVLLWTPLGLPKAALLAGVAVVTLGLLWFLARKLRGGTAAALFCVVWYAATIAPVLPLRDHLMEYYLYLPLIGACWLGGWAFAEAWRATARARVAAVALAALYVVLVLPRTVHDAAENRALTVRVRNLVEGVARAHELHPRQSILLVGVDSELFWNSFPDHPFRLIGAGPVYLASGSERHIDAQPNLGNIGEFLLPADVAANALARDELAVYDVRGPRLRNITTAYAAVPREIGLPARIDVASPLTSYLLGPEWYPVDGNHRWIPKRATLRIAGASAAGQKLYLSGYCPDELTRGGPLTVTVTVEGSTQSAALPPGRNDFELAFPLPASAVGKPELHVTVEVSRTIRAPGDARDLGLAIGVFEVR
ncbi:MAG: hypothetical protein LAP87_04755 [Acidobacteriia bacterium]|nr:hypothetical protein [Terriglobia bacterium]